jgi:hypothetical protein
MSPINRGSRARILIRIEELATRLGSMERQLGAAGPNMRPIIEVGMHAIRRELSDLSRRLR